MNWWLSNFLLSSPVVGPVGREAGVAPGTARIGDQGQGHAASEDPGPEHAQGVIPEARGHTAPGQGQLGYKMVL